MITKLTPEQEAQFDVYVKKYTDIGLSTERIDREKAKKTIEDLYVQILEKPKVPVVFYDNPLEAWEAVVAIKTKGDKDVKVGYVYPWLDGSFQSNIFAFYDFFINEVKIEIEEEVLAKYKIWRDTMDLGLIYPLDEICIISEKPTEIHKNEHGLHKEGGPALVYAGNGDFKLYYLNGVDVGKEIAETPAENIDSKLVLETKNVEVRKELIKKLGIERVLIDLDAKSVERDAMYELLNFDIIDGRYRPYLKMLNPSTGNWHVEGVHPDCKTIKEALAWRDGEEEYRNPDVLT